MAARGRRGRAAARTGSAVRRRDRPGGRTTPHGDDWEADAGGHHDRGARRTWPAAWARPSRRPAAAGIRLYGFAEHIVTTTYLGSSTGLRRRGVQPTGRLELNAKTARPDAPRPGSAGRPATSPTSTSAALHAEISTRLGWARQPDRPAAGTVRDAAAARAGRRPDDLRVLDGQRPRRRGGPQRLRAPGTAGPRSAAAVRAADRRCSSDPQLSRAWSACRSSTSASATDETSWTFDVGAADRRRCTWIERRGAAPS